MTAPIEFTTEHIAENSPDNELLYAAFFESREPWDSMIANNPWLKPPAPNKPLVWGENHYWDTTTGRRHPYWSNTDLPVPTKDIYRMRSDLRTWGYCLIEDGLSAGQCQRFRETINRQAEGEQAAGVAHKTPSGQIVNTLVNKGDCFVGCIEQHPDAVQAGPIIEQIMNETLGGGWICHSFLAISSDPGAHPQGLHIDQGPLLPWMTEEAPALMNTMYIPQDVDDDNGGTLIIPGSHRMLIEAGSGGAIGELPPAINLEAPAGTIMLFDGRVFHGTGANRSATRRFVAVMSNVKAWMRTQENWIVSVAPDVLESASDKLKHRMGLQAVTYGATVEGFGLGAPGRVGDAWGDITGFRQALDHGRYERVRELSPDSDPELLGRPYTIREAMKNMPRVNDQKD